MKTAEQWHAEALKRNSLPIQMFLAEHSVDDLKRVQADALRHAAELYLEDPHTLCRTLRELAEKLEKP